MYQLILIMFVIIQTGANNYSDYCKLDCQTPSGIQKHTVCLRASAKCGRHNRCRKRFEVLNMTNDFRQVILDRHNYFRNKVALGDEKRGPQPAATNMNILNWSYELEFIAQCWANACLSKEYDKCARTEHLVVGQNIAEITVKGRLKLDETRPVENVIHNWYNEVAGFNPASIQNYDGNPRTRHYTEMIWGEIQYMGCGGTVINAGFTILVVCNYGGSTTGGNLLGAKVYNIGKTCSQCPLPCNQKYTGLCGLAYPLTYAPNDKASYYAEVRYPYLYPPADRLPIGNGLFDSTIVRKNFPMRRQRKLKIEVVLPKIMIIRLNLRHF